MRAFKPAQGDPASWTVIGDDDVTQTQVERGDGSDAKRHGVDFHSSEAGRWWTGLDENALGRCRFEDLGLDHLGRPSSVRIEEFPNGRNGRLGYQLQFSLPFNGCIGEVQKTLICSPRRGRVGVSPRSTAAP